MSRTDCVIGQSVNQGIIIPADAGNAATRPRRLAVKQDATPAQPHTGNFAGRAPVEQRAAAHRQPGQQLFFVNEATSPAGVW